MAKEKFLNEEQVIQLTDKKWFVNPKGAYIHLYRDDFSSDTAWSDICEQVGASNVAEKISILYFGTKSKE